MTSKSATAGKRPKPTTCRMFDTPLMEAMSHIPPASPFFFWIPVNLAILSWVLFQGLGTLMVVGLLLAGWLAWTLTEFTLHRWVFHYKGPKAWQRRFYFIAHGVHHDYPQDAKRLVMPLGISVPVGLSFFLIADALAARPIACAMFVGFVSGYLLYDGIHYFTHHLKARGRIGKFLKKHHMVHHHTGVDGLYGVSSPLWDFVFRTQSDRRARPAAR